MKFHNFGYLLKEGVKNLWKNRTMSIASIGVARSRRGRGRRHRGSYTQALAAVTGEKARLVTDDCSLFELAGLPVRLTEGDYANYKITTKEG